ncbi:uncharacterized protein EHS24_005472 [Apiotrichum porosum]|uniref:Uncharacterized protein n=1 Tax=Apiotrichum porosum TaxID=105984 RepID=A0A427XCQ2_9TREE|nr:uncharacterized protein EHS24_005472 [Apiotrichum porosum]RSH76587.1 hypothetical protein EHS24_005472 [Apiotrichum porosum]
MSYPVLNPLRATDFSSDDISVVTIDATNIVQLEKIDMTMTMAELGRADELAAAVDEWNKAWVNKAYDGCHQDIKNVAFSVLPRIKLFLSEDSRGLFVFDAATGFVKKSFPFGSSMRDVFLKTTHVGHDGQEHQLLDKSYTIMLHAGGAAVRKDHETLRDDPTRNALPFNNVIAAARRARGLHAVGLYLRVYEFFGMLLLYLGLSIDMGTRQYSHDRDGVNELIREFCAAQGVSGADWSAIVYCHFGNRNFTDMPPPVLASMENLVVGGGRFTSRLNKMQVNVVNTYFRLLPRALTSTSGLTAPRRDDLLATWSILFHEYKDMGQQWRDANVFGAVPSSH